MVPHKGFSTSALLTFGAGSFFAGGILYLAGPVYRRMFSSTQGLYPLNTSSSSSPPQPCHTFIQASCDNLVKCPSGTKITPAEFKAVPKGLSPDICPPYSLFSHLKRHLLAEHIRVFWPPDFCTHCSLFPPPGSSLPTSSHLANSFFATPPPSCPLSEITA